MAANASVIGEKISEKTAYAIARRIQGASTHVSISELYNGTRLRALADLNEVICRDVQQVISLGNSDESALPEKSRSSTYLTRNGKTILCLDGSPQEQRAILARCGAHLKSLEISGSGLTTLELGEMNDLTTLLLQDNHSLTSIHGLNQHVALTTFSISNSAQLVALDLSGCQKLGQILCLDGLTQLTNLDLAGCCSLTELPSLDSLTQLTNLDLEGCRSLTELPSLDSLTQLAIFDLRDCSSLIILPSLDKLTRLTDLVLRGCRSLSRLPCLDVLAWMTHLDLSDCSSLTHLPSLDRLVLLTHLDLSGCSSLTQLPSLDNLIQLTRLDLGSCSSLTQLPSISQLTQLTYLNLTRCSSLVQLPDLDNVTQLTGLYLGGCSSLTQLPSLDKLTQLTTLYLWGCTSLTHIPSMDTLMRLTDLELSGCSIPIRLPEGIRNMKNLKKLFLRDLKLEALPDWLPEIAEQFSTARFDLGQGKQKAIVNLFGTTVEGVDMSIFEQPYEMVVKWFEAQKLGRTYPLNEIKVVFLGDGEAGKSHTIARLMNDGGEPDKQIFDGQSTPGIVIRNKHYDLDGRDIQVNYWDFGGQEIMHSMHRIFLTGRTMYVILLNARDDTQGDRARYWLHNVKSFAPDAPVLLVLNKIDQNENASVDEADLRARYGKLTQVVRLSAKDFDPEEFNNRFTKVLLEEIQNTGYLDAHWPASWAQVKQKLENMESHYILGDAYQTICEECQVDDHQKNLLHWFNDLGVSFCCCDDGDYALEDYVILRPDWITNALYIILFNKLEGAENGLIPHDSIYRMLKNARTNSNIRCTLPQARYSSGDIQYVLGVMRKFSLSFPHGSSHEFIPMLCQQTSTVDIQYYHKDADILEFNMEFDYLPNNLLHRLMVDRHSELDITNVWRTGARFQLPELGLSSVVVIDGNTLRFFIRHADEMHRPNTYLTMLKANVDRIVKKMGLKAPDCKLVYKVHGKRAVFGYDRLLKMHARGRREEYCEDLDEDFLIADILNQSAPEGLEDERKLLQSVLKSCEQIQREPECRGSKEDNRNRRMRDTLENRGYEVYDQRQMGASSSRKDVGELDLMLYRGEKDQKKPWSIIEALRVSDGAKRDWNNHLGKLLDNYNPHGVPFLFLVTYADCEKEQFKKIWKGYQEHIQQHNAGKFEYEADSFQKLNTTQDSYYIQTAVSRYRCSGYMPTVYHIFVQMDPK